MSDRTSGAAGAPRWVTIFSPIAKALLGAGVPLGFNGLITIRGRKSGLPRTTPVAIIDVGRPAVGLGAMGRRPVGPQPARRRPRDHHRARPGRGGHRDRAGPGRSASSSFATSSARSRGACRSGPASSASSMGSISTIRSRRPTGRPVFELLEGA